MRPLIAFLLTLPLAGLWLISGCSQDRSAAVAGKYEARATEEGKVPTAALDLLPDHRGTWATEQDNVTFKWEKRGEEVWLHTQSGGVIVGKISGDGIVFHLPEGSRYHFRRTPARPPE